MLAFIGIRPGIVALDISAAGGYTDGLIAATQQYIDLLLRSRTDVALREQTLREVVVAMGNADVHYYAPYEDVHRQNLDAVSAADPQSASP